MTLDDLEGQNQGHEKKLQFFCSRNLIFWHLVDTKALNTWYKFQVIQCIRTPSKEQNMVIFLLTSEVHISETVADRHIVTINHI